MVVRISYDLHSTEMHLPADVYEIMDVLDKLRQYDSSRVSCTIERCNYLNELDGMSFNDDLYRINAFAQLIETDTPDAEIKRAMIKAMLKRDNDRSLDTLIRVLYTPDLTVHPCRDYMSYGEIVIDNNWMPELEGVPDEAVPYLDTYEVGKEMAQREHGVFVDGYYCIPDADALMDVDLQIGEPERSFFCLTIAPKGRDATRTGEIYYLPQDAGRISEFAHDIGLEIDDLEIVDFKSALPRAEPPTTISIDNVYVYQTLANKLRDNLTHKGIVTLKAVMETKPPMSAAQLNKLIDNIHRYDFDSTVYDTDDYGYKYVAGIVPANFKMQMFSGCHFNEIGEKLCEEKNSHITEYGAISDMDQKLYSMITVHEETEDEDCYTDYDDQPSEDDDIGMG